MRPMPLLLALGAGIVLLTAAGLSAQPADSWGGLTRHDAIRYIGFALAAGALYGVAVWLTQTRRFPARAVAAVLALALVARLLVLFAPPLLSTDLYRYVWDGRVQAAGINPYLHIPADAELIPLRDTVPGPTAIYPNINRVDSAPTIYPPAAQLLFALIGLTAPSVWTVKAAMLGFDLLTAAVLLLLLRAAGRPDVQVLVWAWNPLVIWEFANGGHIDAAALAASALALLAATRLRPAWAGAALAAAVLFKLLPAALFPALWRRWDWKLPVVAGLVIVGSYGLYASAGLRVVGYLPGYASEEGLDGGGFLLTRLLALLVPMHRSTGLVYAAAALLLLAGLAARIAFAAPFPADLAARTRRIGRDALILTGALMALLSPHYPWYLTMLLVPATLTPACSALWLTMAAPLLYLDHGHGEVLWPALVFLPALPLLAYDVHAARRSKDIADA